MVAADLVDAVLAAADWADAILAAPAVGERWTEPSALEHYTVGGLGGHLVAATERTVATLDLPFPDGGRTMTIVDAFAANRIDTPEDQQRELHPLLRANGEERAAGGQRAVLDAFREAVGVLGERLPGEDLDRLVPLVRYRDAGTSLRGYLQSRCLEIVVHGDDLVVSAGIDPPPPPVAAARHATDLLLGIATARSGDIAVLRALARRERGDVEVLRAL